MSTTTTPSKITMTVTPQEKRALEAQAKQAARTVSNFIRTKLDLAPVKIGRPTAK